MTFSLSLVIPTTELCGYHVHGKSFLSVSQCAFRIEKCRRDSCTFAFLQVQGQSFQIALEIKVSMEGNSRIEPTPPPPAVPGGISALVDGGYCCVRCCCCGCRASRRSASHGSSVTEEEAPTSPPSSSPSPLLPPRFVERTWGVFLPLPPCLCSDGERFLETRGGGTCDRPAGALPENVLLLPLLPPLLVVSVASLGIESGRNTEERCAVLSARIVEGDGFLALPLLNTQYCPQSYVGRHPSQICLRTRDTRQLKLRHEHKQQNCFKV